MRDSSPPGGRFTHDVAHAAADEAPDDDAPVCVIACQDLIGYSRLASAARGSGYRVVQAEGPVAVRAAAAEATIVLVDLQDAAGGLASVRAAAQSSGPRIYAIGPHVETELLEQAEKAGATQVLTHSAVATKLPDLLTTTGPPTTQAAHPEPTPKNAPTDENTGRHA